MSESKSASTIDDFEKLQRSAHMSLDYRLEKSLMQLLSERKTIAINVMNCKNEDNYKELMHIYDQLNYQIKQLLSI